MKKTTSRKAIFTLFIMFFCPFVFFALYTYIYIGVSAKNEFKNTMYRFNENTSNAAVERPVKEISNLLNVLSSHMGDNGVEQFINDKTTETNSVIPTLINLTGFFSAVIISDTNKKFRTYPSVGLDSDFDITKRPWYYSTNPKHKINFSDVYPNIKNPTKKDITVSMSLFNRSYKELGVIAFDLDLKSMSNSLKNIKPPYNGRFKVVSSDGSIVLYQNTNQLFKKNVPIEWIHKATEIEGDFFDSNERKYVYYRTFNEPDWIAFSVVDEASYDSHLDVAYKTYYLAITLSIVFYAVVLLVLSLYFKQFIARLYMSINGLDLENTSDITQVYNNIKAKNKELNNAIYNSETDGLTGINNRLKYDKDITELVLKKTPFALSVIDIDDFKKINDTYGHDVGDIVLKYVASTGLTTMSEGDKSRIYRFGGEELIVLITGEAISEVCEKIDIWRNLVDLKEWREKDLHVTFSGGITLWRKEDDANEVFKRADSLLYKAKNSGKNLIISDF